MSTDTDVRQPWDPLDGETAKAYLAFCAYLELPYRERSVAAAYRLHMNKPDAAAPSGTFAGWSMRFGWVERAKSRDAQQERDKATDFAVERRASANQRLQIGRFAVGKAFEGLSKLDTDKLTAGDIARLLEIGHKLQREATADAMPAPAVVEGDDVLDSIAAMYRERALAGDEKAAEILVRLEERIAKARGTDAPERHLHGIENTIERLSDGIALANLSPALRRQVVDELEDGDEEVDGEEA